MVDVDEIEGQIARREMGDTSWANCQALAILYIVRDHLRGATPTRASEAPQASGEAIPALGDSEFLQAASGADVAALMAIIDDHMERVRAVFPREYEDVLRRVRSIG